MGPGFGFLSRKSLIDFRSQSSCNRLPVLGMVVPDRSTIQKGFFKPRRAFPVRRAASNSASRGFGARVRFATSSSLTSPESASPFFSVFAFVGPLCFQRTRQKHVKCCAGVVLSAKLSSWTLRQGESRWHCFMVKRIIEPNWELVTSTFSQLCGTVCFLGTPLWQTTSLDSWPIRSMGRETCYVKRRAQGFLQDIGP